MSHINITRRDRDSTVERQRLEYAKLKAERDQLESMLEDSEKSLASIFDRIEQGEEVYLCYPDGSKIWLVGRRKPGTPASDRRKT